MHHKPLTIDATLDTLDWLKENEMATRLESAIARVIAEGKVRKRSSGLLLIASQGVLVTLPKIGRVVVNTPIPL